MGEGAIFPSPRLRGEGGAASAAGGEGIAPLLPSPSPSLGFASHFPLPLKGARGFGITAQGNEYGLQDAVEVGHHVCVGESNHSVAALFERSRSRSVVSLASAVGVTVDFDDEAVRAGAEVGDVGGEDDLLLELHAEAARAEVVPEAAFGFGEVFPQLFGAGSGFDVPFDGTAPSPRSASLTRPLPLKGARGLDRHAATSVYGCSLVNA